MLWQSDKMLGGPEDRRFEGNERRIEMTHQTAGGAVLQPNITGTVANQAKQLL
jgi:hypothetical protein